VLAQNYENFEHIIMDGGSADGTVDILREYPHLKWISEPDEGEADALNKALKMAAGDIIGWLNADDWYEDCVFVKVWEVMNPAGGVHAVYGDTAFVDEIRNERFIKKTARDMTLGGVFMRWWHDKQPRQPYIFIRGNLWTTSGCTKTSCITRSTWNTCCVLLSGINFILSTRFFRAQGSV